MNDKTRRLLSIVASVLLFITGGMATAASFSLPGPNTHIVGSTATIVAKADDTFSSIALEYQIGFDAIASANPTLNPWFPGAGTELILPVQHILPDISYEGIVINLPELRLYYFPKDSGKVFVFPVGIGRAGWETPLADTRVTRIDKNPAWHPPVSIINEYKDAGLYLPPRIPPGPDNPLGDTSIRLALAGYLLHGTNRPEGVGMKVSHGCIRLYPEHIRDLAAMVQQGTRVRIINQPVKWGNDGNTILVEAHRKTDSAQRVSTVARASLVDRTPALKRWLSDRQHQQKLFTGVPQVYAE